MNTEDEKAEKPGFAGLADLAAMEYRWPKKGDRLLRAEDDWQRSVTFDEHQISRHVHIWEGYMKAGALLVEQCESEGNLDRYQLVYPILFCYRHGLELAMKWIIGRYGRFAHVIGAAGVTTGFSAAGITSGLAAIGGLIGGGMAAGVFVATTAPVAAAAGVGYGAYKLRKYFSGKKPDSHENEELED